MKKYMVILILSAFVFFIGVVFFVSVPGRDVVVSVEPGMPALKVARMLKDEGVIISETLFIIVLKLANAERKIKKGVYELEKGMSLFKLMRKIVIGDVLLVRLTVPEGYTAGQIASLVKEKGLGESHKFMDIVNKRGLEGYLFPDTYLVSRDSSEEDIINIMTRQFDRMFTKETLDRAKKFRFTKHDVVTLASIIEREAVKESERRTISAVFHNRLRKRYYLESCATIMYALGEHREKLLYEDMEIDSPYNTYRRFGLPPGPICNPGINSIKAAVDPEDTDLMFFVSKGDGTHRFSRYYEKHLEVQQEK